MRSIVLAVVDKCRDCDSMEMRDNYPCSQRAINYQRGGAVPRLVRDGGRATGSHATKLTHSGTKVRKARIVDLREHIHSTIYFRILGHVLQRWKRFSRWWRISPANEIPVIDIHRALLGRIIEFILFLSLIERRACLPNSIVRGGSPDLGAGLSNLRGCLARLGRAVPARRTCRRPSLGDA